MQLQRYKTLERVGIFVLQLQHYKTLERVGLFVLQLQPTGRRRDNKVQKTVSNRAITPETPKKYRIY
jgi:hypothetical protein